LSSIAWEPLHFRARPEAQLFLPQRPALHQRFQRRPRRWRIIEHAYKGIAFFGIEQ
jgi:hypothetical protein